MSNAISAKKYQVTIGNPSTGAHLELFARTIAEAFGLIKSYGDTMQYAIVYNRRRDYRIAARYHLDNSTRKWYKAAF